MKPTDICTNCQRPRSEHITVAYAGATLMDTPYICPTAIFKVAS